MGRKGAFEGGEEPKQQNLRTKKERDAVSISLPMPSEGGGSSEAFYTVDVHLTSAFCDLPEAGKSEN